MSNEIKLYPKYAIGDTLYTIMQKHAYDTCPQCAGVGEYINGQAKFYCSSCQGSGSVKTSKQKWFPCENVVLVTGYRFTVGKNETVIKYRGKMYGATVNRAENALYRTIEESQAECDRRNVEKITLPLASIKIQDEWVKTIPSPEKIAERVQEWKSKGRFNTRVAVDKNAMLLDGYSAYLVAKMFDVQEMKVEVA
jgi:hypothetical protein